MSSVCGKLLLPTSSQRKLELQPVDMLCIFTICLFALT